MSRLVSVLVLLCSLMLLVGCAERKSSKGWAAQVPKNAVRYAEQPEKPAACVPGVKPPGSTPVQPTLATPEWESKVTEATEITVWHAYRASEKKALQEVAASFHKLGSKITVTLRMVPFDAFKDKLKIVIPEGRGPDLFISAHNTIGAWAERGFIEPLNNWIQASDTKRFITSTVRSLVYRNALYGFPMAFKCVTLYYDKKKIATPPTTLDGLIAVAKKHTDGEDAYGLVYEATNLYFHAPWIHGMGGQVLDELDKPHANTAGAVAALELAARLVKTEEVTPLGVSTSMVSGYFNDGLAAMVINGPWMRGEISDDMDYGVVPLPLVSEGMPARPFLGVEALYMNRHSKNKQAAFEVMSYFTSDAAAEIRARVGQQTVANTKIWADGTHVDEIMLAFKAQMDQAVLMSSSPRLEQVWTPYNAALLAVIGGSDAAKEALATAQKRIEAGMKRAGGGE